jgi:hypothetical protein
MHTNALDARGASIGKEREPNVIRGDTSAGGQSDEACIVFPDRLQPYPILPLDAGSRGARHLVTLPTAA